MEEGKERERGKKGMGREEGGGGIQEREGRRGWSQGFTDWTGHGDTGQTFPHMRSGSPSHPQSWWKKASLRMRRLGRPTASGGVRGMPHAPAGLGLGLPSPTPGPSIPNVCPPHFVLDSSCQGRDPVPGGSAVFQEDPQGCLLPLFLAPAPPCAHGSPAPTPSSQGSLCIPESLGEFSREGTEGEGTF